MSKSNPSQLSFCLNKQSTLRLMSDYKEWLKTKDELPCIDAFPLESNIYEWHCNIAPNYGVFKSVCLHLILKFPIDYPVNPPKVILCNTIKHPNVYGDFICLDMIRDKDQGRYRGWSSGYSITSILMQLQSFLFEENTIDQDGGYSIKRNISEGYVQKLMKQLERFQCNNTECGHTIKKPNPYPKSMMMMAQQEAEAKAKIQARRRKRRRRKGGKTEQPEELHKVHSKCVRKKQNHIGKNNAKETEKEDFLFWEGIYGDLEGCILEFLSVCDVFALKRVCKKFSIVIEKSGIIEKDKLKCWFHRSDKFDGELLCLGYGCSIREFTMKNGNFGYGNVLGNFIWSTDENDAEYITDIKNKIGNIYCLDEINTSFDLLSYHAFMQCNVRKSMFNEFNFAMFIPVYLNKKHGNLCLKYIDRCICPPTTCPNYHPFLTLDTIANIMKSLVVSVMKTSNDYLSGNKIDYHHSIGIINAFIRYHHLLLAYYFEYENELSRMIQNQLNSFINDKQYRSKKYVPNFGTFIIYFMLWDPTEYVKNKKKEKKNKDNTDTKDNNDNENYDLWQDLVEILLDESFTRQVGRILKSSGRNSKIIYLNDERKCSVQERIDITFNEAPIFYRALMFQYFFFNHVCEFNNLSMTPKLKLDEYNNNYGFPKNKNLPLLLQKFIKYTQNECTNFRKFFKIINFKYSSNDVEFDKWLKNCLIQSEINGYHDARTYGVYEDRFGLRQKEKEEEMKRIKKLREQELNKSQDSLHTMNDEMKAKLEKQVNNALTQEREKYRLNNKRMPFGVKIKIRRQVEQEFLKQLQQSDNNSNNKHNENVNQTQASHQVQTASSGVAGSMSLLNTTAPATNDADLLAPSNTSMIPMEKAIEDAISKEREECRLQNKPFTFGARMRIRRQIIKQYQR